MSERRHPMGLSDEHIAIREVVRDFVDSRVIPTASEREAKGEYPADLIPKLAELGVMGMTVPEEYGGSEVDYISYGLILEELARGWMGLASVVGSSAAGGFLISKYGTKEQKDMYLPRLGAGTRVSGMALTEPGVGSDLKNAVVTAKKVDGKYIVNGTKTMITHARRADPLLVLVRTDTTVDPAHRGMSLLLVEQGTPGYTIGRDMEKLGQKGVDLCELVFENAEIPAENLLGGEEGQGFYQIMSALDRGRIYIAAASVGIAQASLEAAAKYAQERQAFGQNLAEFQAVQLRVAEMGTKIEAARLLYINAATSTEKFGRATAESSMAKIFASEIGLEAAYDAMRIHGGYGYTKEFPIERYLRDVALNPIGEGSNDVLRLGVAKELFNQYK